MSGNAVHVMNSKVLHEQLSIILGALTKAAVVEICEVVDEGYAVLQMEITRSHKENEDLKKKLHLIESIIVRGNGGNVATDAAVQAASSAEAVTNGDADKTAARELPDVVLIKDEDSDINDSFEEGAEISEDGRTCGAGEPSTSTNRNKRLWPGSEEAVCQDDRKQSSEQQSRRSPASRQKVLAQYSLASPRSEPGCSSHSGGDERGAGESVCSFSPHVNPETGHLPPQECSLVSPSSSSSRQQAHFGPHGIEDALLESQSSSSRGELDLGGLWTKQSKLASQMPFAAFQQHESFDSDAFGLRMIGVSGSAATDGHLSEGSSSAFDFEDAADALNFGLQGGRLLHAGALPGVRGKRYVCPICSKTYATSQNLEVHMRIHTGERPFSCPQCGKKFTQSAHLKSHLSVHSGERPFMCALCSKSFIVKYSLKLHMKKCHTTN